MRIRGENADRIPSIKHQQHYARGQGTSASHNMCSGGERVHEVGDEVGARGEVHMSAREYKNQS
ncbi:MAG: hypothetical protein EOO65_00570 [Methanosarcinales archaeon]|nr:MAG: hypothetical protein EOO65_00570 [Methanosarcinales archaeon]